MKEPVYLKSSGGLVNVNVGARPSVLRGELVSERCGEEPVCLRSSGGLVNVNSESSSLCVGGIARQ